MTQDPNGKNQTTLKSTRIELSQVPFPTAAEVGVLIRVDKWESFKEGAARLWFYWSLLFSVLGAYL